MLAVVAVTTDQDIVDFNDGVTSLREAIFATNLVPGADEIRFDLDPTGPATIVLTKGKLKITDSLVITGPGAELLTIDASGNDPTPAENNGDGSRVFSVGDAAELGHAELLLDSVTITGADSSGDGGAIWSHGRLKIRKSSITGNSANSGGGIWANRYLTISDSNLTKNHAQQDGGAVAASDSLIVFRSQLTGNIAGESGGAIAHNGTKKLTIDSSTISENLTENGSGGGIYTKAPTLVVDSTFERNNARRGGGGVGAHDSLEIRKSFFVENRALGGGALLVETNGDLSIDHTVIRANSALDGSGGGILGSGNVIIRTSKILDNNSEGSEGGGIAVGRGTLEVVDSLVSGNKADFSRGGGIAAHGSTSIIESTISDNDAWSTGGGVFSDRNLTISSSTVKNNRVGDPLRFLGDGGGVHSTGRTTIVSSTLSGNAAVHRGGGGYFMQIVNIINSTISANGAYLGGGIVANHARIAFRHSTVTNNRAEPLQGALGTVGGIAGHRVTLDHTIVAGNHDASNRAPDLDSPVVSHNSIIGNNQSVNQTMLTEAPLGAPDANGNLVGGEVHGLIDPLLGPLANNGGPTLTHALLPGSPAINVGDPALQQGVAGLPEFDQRGAPFGRVVGGHIDIGAYESQPATGTLDGDFDNDGDVDGSDFLTLQRHFNTAENASGTDGDATGDGDIDEQDLAVWEATFLGSETGLRIVELPAMEQSAEDPAVVGNAAFAMLDRWATGNIRLSAIGSIARDVLVVKNRDLRVARSRTSETTMNQAELVWPYDQARGERPFQSLVSRFEDPAISTQLEAVDAFFGLL